MLLNIQGKIVVAVVAMLIKIPKYYKNKFN